MFTLLWVPCVDCSRLDRVFAAAAVSWFPRRNLQRLLPSEQDHDGRETTLITRLQEQWPASMSSCAWAYPCSFNFIESAADAEKTSSPAQVPSGLTVTRERLRESLDELGVL
jgi:hypothetical protein